MACAAFLFDVGVTLNNPPRHQECFQPGRMHTAAKCGEREYSCAEHFFHIAYM